MGDRRSSDLRRGERTTLDGVGGGTVYVSELDPKMGSLVAEPPDSEFDTHPTGTHTPVATWNGDEWTGDGGGLLFKLRPELHHSVGHYPGCAAKERV